jgi:endonuclease/exonuclease/phosphatase family metal-dependent hydrolase
MKCLQYNVFGVPFASFDITQRHRKICSRLKKKMNGVDIIVLCEVFTDSSRKMFSNFFKRQGWNSYRSPSSKNFLLSAGLLVASKHRFLCAKHEIFTDYNFVDGLAYKGFMSVLIKYPTNGAFKVVRVVATHMQDETWDSSGRVRKNQILQLKNAIDNYDAFQNLLSFAHFQNLPTMIIGDFNIRMHSKVFKFAQKNIGPHFTQPREKTHEEGVLDYAFFRNMSVLDLKVSQFVDDEKPLSDHLFVETKFLV